MEEGFGKVMPVYVDPVAVPLVDEVAEPLALALPDELDEPNPDCVLDVGDGDVEPKALPEVAAELLLGVVDVLGAVIAPLEAATDEFEALPVDVEDVTLDAAGALADELGLELAPDDAPEGAGPEPLEPEVCA